MIGTNSFSVRYCSDSKISPADRNEGIWMPLSELLARAELHALNNNLTQNQSFSYPTRTRFLLEARINRLE